MIDLNDQLATANGVAGGKQTVHTASTATSGSCSISFAKQVSATNVGDAGAKFDAFAVRTHIAL